MKARNEEEMLPTRGDIAEMVMQLLWPQPVREKGNTLKFNLPDTFSHGDIEDIWYCEFF